MFPVTEQEKKLAPSIWMEPEINTLIIEALVPFTKNMVGKFDFRKIRKLIEIGPAYRPGG